MLQSFSYMFVCIVRVQYKPTGTKRCNRRR